jgi:DNA-directed RNA polymerase subunit RPC12/RpoP
MKRIQQRRYKCPTCKSQVILYGGNTVDTSVVCNCGTWMDIKLEMDRTELSNTEDTGVSGVKAVDKPLNDNKDIKGSE